MLKLPILLTKLLTMGEIIIKVPEDVKEEIKIDLPYSKVKEKIEELKKEERLKRIEKFLNRYGGKLDIEEVSEEEIHLQGD